jgi:hypothetical protein
MLVWLSAWCTMLGGQCSRCGSAAAVQGNTYAAAGARAGSSPQHTSAQVSDLLALALYFIPVIHGMYAHG